MKRLIALFILIVLGSCQKEELTVVQEQDDQNAIASLDLQLQQLIQSVTSHDGSFDDVVDGSACFSINFPYEVFFEGEPYAVNSLQDLAPFDSSDILVPIFPIEVTHGDYRSETVTSFEFFLTLQDRCQAGSLYDDGIYCLDMAYPMEIALYDSQNVNFETITLDHDQLTFQTLGTLSSEIIAEINYPIDILLNDGTYQAVSSNEDLKDLIIQARAACQ